MKELKRVSRWITVKNELITKKHNLWYYADKDSTFDERYAYVSCFRWNGRKYAINQFLARFGMFGLDKECNEYPAFISAYDCENYYNPLLMEMDEYGEKVRLYIEI